MEVTFVIATEDDGGGEQGWRESFIAQITFPMEYDTYF